MDKKKVYSGIRATPLRQGFEGQAGRVYRG